MQAAQRRRAMRASYPIEAGPASDETLLLGFADGDTAAGLAFVRRFERRVYGVAVGLVGDSALAEDVAQEAFVRAWRHAARYDPARGSVTSWLLRITHNAAIDTLRRRRPEPVDTDMIASLIRASPAGSVEAAALTSHLAAEARTALARLPPPQATALLLAAFYGHSAQEISLSEHVPLGTVKTRIRRGMRTLRAQLAHLDDEPSPDAADRSPESVCQA